MKNSILKLTARNIRASLGRYLALLLIVMLSVGFFSGLKVTRAAMANTCGDYLTGQSFYDYRLVSSLGMTEKAEAAFSALSEVRNAEGSCSTDALLSVNGKTAPFKLISMPENINLPSLTAGRLPQTDEECLGDSAYFSESEIGSKVQIEGENLSLFQTTFTLVGLADSPLYLGEERGTTSIGSGTLAGFLYLPKAVFQTDGIYTDLYLTLDTSAAPYSSEYDSLIEANRTTINDQLNQCAQQRYQDMLSANQLTPEMAESAGLSAPETYLLTRDENIGYVTFESNTSIISGIANIFPVFFILIAMLVCMTTMTRMVEEERTQLGVLKATGFGSGAMMGKYLLYAGSATVIGWGLGFFLGTWGLPQVFWFAYSSMYSFAPLKYLFGPGLAAATLLVALASILGSTWFSCRRALKSVPAQLLRPSAPKAGKEILLEKVPFLWNHLSFLQKVSLRNMFRYKRRLFMMLIGISCCAGLILTAFGVRDSMVNIGSEQFENIQHYDLQASYPKGSETAAWQELSGIDGITEATSVLMEHVDVGSMKNVNLLCVGNSTDLTPFWNFHSDNSPITLPEAGAAIVSQKIAERLGLSAGDLLEVQNGDHQKFTVTVSGIFSCYVENYVVVSEETYRSAFGFFESNTALILSEGSDQALAEAITALPDVSSVSQLSVAKESIDSTLSCLDYIIWLIVLFSGALAFIVIFNLTNINLAERSREVATVEVLGFYPEETAKYILQENLILSLVAGVIGLPLGMLFHRTVMKMIDLDTLAFRVHIAPMSFAAALICTVLFALLVNTLMKRQVSKVKMAESLKAVE